MRPLAMAFVTLMAVSNIAAVSPPQTPDRQQQAGTARIGQLLLLLCANRGVVMVNQQHEVYAFKPELSVEPINRTGHLDDILVDPGVTQIS